MRQALVNVTKGNKVQTVVRGALRKELLLDVLAVFATFIICTITLLVTTVWFTGYFVDKERSLSPFELAQISATVGGFVLIFGQIGLKVDESLKNSLRWAGIFFLVATLGFVATGMLLPVFLKMKPEGLMYQVLLYLTGISLAIAMVTVAIATVPLFISLHKLARMK